MKDPSAFPRLELSQDFRDYRFICSTRACACVRVPPEPVAKSDILALTNGSQEDKNMSDLFPLLDTDIHLPKDKCYLVVLYF